MAPPPIAVSTRPIKNGVIVEDNGITIVPTRKNVHAIANRRRRPMTSLSRPASGITETKAMRYTFTIQAASSRPSGSVRPRSLMIGRNIVVTTVRSSAATKTEKPTAIKIERGDA